ncbi:MAG: phosphoglucosamine mutase, partial [Clostridiales Family XIII bacterium]|nr:phosphoglucosamine mutase [Clostridiales Family XIII bacterium]
MGRLFGTDGVRGIAGDELTPELACALGKAGTSVLSKETHGGSPLILIGKDTRISCD